MCNKYWWLYRAITSVYYYGLAEQKFKQTKQCRGQTQPLTLGC